MKKLISVLLALVMCLSLCTVAWADAESVTFTDVNGTTTTYLKETNDTGVTFYFENEANAANYATASYELDGQTLTFKGATLRSVNNLMRAYWEVSKKTTGCDYDASKLPANGTAALTWTIYGTVEQGEYTKSNALLLPVLSGGYIYNDGGYNWKNIAVNAGTKDAAIVSNNTFDVDHTYVSAGTESTTFTGITLDGSVYVIPHGGNVKFTNCTFKGMLRTSSGNGDVTVEYCKFVGDPDTDNSKKNEYPIFFQAGGTLTIIHNTVDGDVYTRGMNVGGSEALNVTIEDNTIGAVAKGYSAIQLSGKVKEAKIHNNRIELNGTNALTLHNSLDAAPEVTITNNTITGTGYFIYDDAKATQVEFTKDNLTLTVDGNTIPSTVDTTKGVKGNNVVAASDFVRAAVEANVPPAPANPDPVNPDPTPVEPEQPAHTNRRYPATTTTTETPAKGNDITSAKTFDGGVALYVGMALTSTLGMAWMGKKRAQ